MHIQDRVNKGEALETLKNLYQQNFQLDYGVIALGDTENDAAMLELAEFAVIVKSPSSKNIQLKKTTHIIQTKSTAPEGWVEGVNSAFSKIEPIHQYLKQTQEYQHGR